MIRINRESELSVQALKSYLHYDPSTGVWTWVKDRGSARVGDSAGYVDKDGYLRVKIGWRGFPSSRLAWFYMTGSWPPVFVDHIDMDRGNGKWENLRLATNSTNQANQRAKVNNSLGIKGVRRINCKKKPYLAEIRFNGKYKYIGIFATAEEASAAYAARAKDVFGEFARAS